MMKTVASEQSPTHPALLNVVLIGLLIAYFPNYISRVLRLTGLEVGPQGPPSVILWNWVAVGLLLCYIFRIEGRGLSSIQLTRPNRKDVFWAVVFGITGIVLQMVLSTVLNPPPGNTELLLTYSLPVIVALILTTATTEEILFRGYVIERLEELTGRLWLAVGCSLVVFLIPHVEFFGPTWLITNGMNVVLLYVLYVWRRNLVACMIMHLLGNSLLLIPALGLAG
ncbi:lysostaphin resistance A-like protein (plasmid) [Haloferacaceae archaeon DSL9]